MQKGARGGRDNLRVTRAPLGVGVLKGRVLDELLLGDAMFSQPPPCLGDVLG